MRLIVVDDDRLVVDSLKIILGAQPQIEVVGTGANGNDAVALYAEHSPDIALLDIQMPGRDGLSAAREILERDPAARVVFLTTFSDDEYIVSALKLGARGYLIKTDVAAIPPALAQVMEGKRVLEGKAIEDIDFDGTGVEAGTLRQVLRLVRRAVIPWLGERGRELGRHVRFRRADKGVLAQRAVSGIPTDPDMTVRTGIHFSTSVA